MTKGHLQIILSNRTKIYWNFRFINTTDRLKGNKELDKIKQTNYFTSLSNLRPYSHYFSTILNCS